jgi:hypothetical protein
MTPLQPEKNYAEAIEALDAAIKVLDRPGAALGYAYGLQRGQWGHLKVGNARDQLRLVRDAMVRHETQEAARSR